MISRIELNFIEITEAPNIACEKQAFILLSSLLSRIHMKKNLSRRVVQVKKRKPEHRLFKKSKI